MKINLGFAQATALVMGAFLRRVALNALNQESTYRRSLAQKSKRAAMDNDYMMAVLKAFCQA
ncbi:MAG: hypothetical protein BEV12_17960 [Microcystis aeruginosa CACIAM 03]|nr:hypothetical protein [Microcystis aeruginosa L311-01]OCY14710.1 MAG: hypothetical protein BEV12_17960 [Microcystis aeruginosa CACIAM 03]